MFLTITRFGEELHKFEELLKLDIGESAGLYKALGTATERLPYGEISLCRVIEAWERLEKADEYCHADKDKLYDPDHLKVLIGLKVTRAFLEEKIDERIEKERDEKTAMYLIQIGNIEERHRRSFKTTGLEETPVWRITAKLHPFTWTNGAELRTTELIVAWESRTHPGKLMTTFGEYRLHSNGKHQWFIRNEQNDLEELKEGMQPPDYFMILPGIPKDIEEEET